MNKRFTILILLLLSATMLSAQVTGLAGWNICLDPGHSYTENMGVYGYSEAERNLGVALALRDILLTQTDIDTVYLTRTSGSQNVSLSQRTDYANSVGAAWFHSIHSDASASAQTNSTLLLWGQTRSLQEKYPPGGQAMSIPIVDLITRVMRTNTSGSWGDWSFYTQWQTASDGFDGPWLYVNRNTSMPSELSESGFHTNPDQNQRFMNHDWKRFEAYAFYWAILKFVGIERPLVSMTSGIIRDADTDVPVNGAHISINGKEYTTDTYASLFNRFTSEEDKLHNGFYFIEDVEQGTWPMVVSADGYYSDTLEVTLSDTFYTFTDVDLVSKIPPLVQSSMPQSGGDNFPAWNDLELTFSRSMNTASVESALSIEPAVAMTPVWTNQNRNLRLIPDSLDYETDYQLTIASSATDIHGHALDGNGDGTGGDDYVLSFHTGPSDMTAPRLVGMTPGRSARDISTRPVITAVFDEKLDSASVADNIVEVSCNLNDHQVSGIIEQIDIGDQSLVQFFPQEELLKGQTYKVVLNAGYADEFGNVAETDKISVFTTSSDSLHITPIDDFEEGFTHFWWGPAQSGSTTGIVANETGQAEDSVVVNLAAGSLRSHRIDYSWDTSATDWLIRVYLGSGDARDVSFQAEGRLQMWVFGDGSGTLLRFCVDEQLPATGGTLHEVSPWISIDWLGWKLVSWDLETGGTGSWLGNGTLEGRLRIDSIQLSYSPGSTASGTLYFDNLSHALPVSVTSVPADDAQPETVALYPNYPNPFNPETCIKFQLQAFCHVSLDIYDVSGRLVSSLVDRDLAPGLHEVMWYGQDENGNAVSSGTYFYRLKAGDEQKIRRMVLIK